MNKVWTIVTGFKGWRYKYEQDSNHTYLLPKADDEAVGDKLWSSGRFVSTRRSLSRAVSLSLRVWVPAERIRWTGTAGWRTEEWLRSLPHLPCWLSPALSWLHWPRFRILQLPQQSMLTSAADLTWDDMVTPEWLHCEEVWHRLIYTSTRHCYTWYIFIFIAFTIVTNSLKRIIWTYDSSHLDEILKRK